MRCARGGRAGIWDITQKPKQKPNYQAFKKTFWRTLGISILSIFLVYGGIVWATLSFDGCDIKFNTFRISEICFELGTDEITKEDTVEFKPENRDIVSTDKIDSDLIGKKLKITNESGKNYFVPFKYQRELDLS